MRPCDLSDEGLISQIDFVRAALTDSANNKEYIYTIGAGESYILFNDSMDANTGSSDLGGAKAMTNIDVIKAKASTTLLLEVMAVAT